MPKLTANIIHDGREFFAGDEAPQDSPIESLRERGLIEDEAPARKPVAKATKTKADAKGAPEADAS
jgi:hypothetical protein